MRCMEINKQTVYYALATGKTEVTDSYGNATGTYTVTYGTPVKVRMHVSPTSSLVHVDKYGVQLDYTHVVTTDIKDCPIAEDSILWIGTTPGTTANPIPYNFKVVSVQKSLDRSRCTRYLVQEVMNG